MIEIDSNRETQELINIAAYITRIDNPFIYYNYYLPSHSPLDGLSIASTESTENHIPLGNFDKIVTNEELVQILNKLLELQKSGITIESKRIPLLSSEFKFKGYRRVEFSYRDANSLHIITVTHKRKEIHIRSTVGG